MEPRPLCRHRLPPHRAEAERARAVARSGSAPERVKSPTDQVVFRHTSSEDWRRSRLSPHALRPGSATPEQPGSSGGVGRASRGVLAGSRLRGTDLFGFKILAEIGRARFGRVYLAGSATWPRAIVALKSRRTSWRIATLAQLQHTNIVPIYSVHRASPSRPCACLISLHHARRLLKNWPERESLPESGKELVRTLWNRKNLTRRCTSPTATGHAAGRRAATACRDPGVAPVHLCRRRTTARHGHLECCRPEFRPGVLWIASRLATGWRHAHERGILHRDS